LTSRKSSIVRQRTSSTFGNATRTATACERDRDVHAAYQVVASAGSGFRMTDFLSFAGVDPASRGQ
jgi:hypothetical protein